MTIVLSIPDAKRAQWNDKFLSDMFGILDIKENGCNN